MANKEPVIVIKKITVQKAGHHGGSWKVAFADFMTAMMAFFLVMWLIGQSEEVKKSVSDYFSTPSVIEYNYANYGAQLTLEKLFLDLVNEPLKAFEQFIKPAEKTPNVMNLGHHEIQMQYVMAKLGEFGAKVNVLSDEITFEIPAEYLFKRESAVPGGQFVPVMEKVREIVLGLRDADIFINVEQAARAGEHTISGRRDLAEARLDLISSKIEASINRENVDIYGKTTVEQIQRIEGKRDTRGMLKFRIKKKFNEVKKVRIESGIPADAPVESVEAKETFDNSVLPEVKDPSDSFGRIVDDISSSSSPETQ